MLLSIFVLVPEGLPWADRTRLSVPDLAGEVCLAFHRTRPPTARADEAYSIAAKVLEGGDAQPPPEADLRRPPRPLDLGHTTVVEITSPLAEEGSDRVHEAVHRSIDALHAADRAAVIATGSTRRPVGPADVWPVIPAVLNKSGGEGSPPRALVIVLGEGKPSPPPPPVLERNALPAVAAAVAAIAAADPIARWKEWRAAAAASQREVRAATAVVELCVAVEVLVDAALGLELYEMGTAPGPACALLRRDLSGQLSAGLGIDPRGWRQATRLRSALLQRGETPAPERMDAAFRAADRLCDEVIGRALARRAERPRTASVLSGECWTAPGGAAPGTRGWLAGYPPWRAAVAAATEARADRVAAT